MDLSIISLGAIDNGQLMSIVIFPIGTWLDFLKPIGKWLEGRITLEEKPLFTIGVYDCFLVERDILQLIV
jgi:hypothetical protein